MLRRDLTPPLYLPMADRDGQLSVLREAALAREMHEAGILGMKYLYMGQFEPPSYTRERLTEILIGFYIHSCPKMRYKGDYSPSYLLDPEDYTWAPLDACRLLLDRYHYPCFTRPERSLDMPATSPGTFCIAHELST